jgi:hypothetical protein
MAEPFDQGEFKRAAFLPEITPEVYHQLARSARSTARSAKNERSGLPGA